jgi:hypothetical protein
MSDTETQDTTVVVPTEDQPNEDTPVVAATPAPVESLGEQVAENGTTPDAVTDPAAVAASAPGHTNTPKERAKASNLEGDLRVVLDSYVDGSFVLPEDTLPTPHALAAEIAKRRGDGHPVSSGAVSAALTRWSEIGFATLGTKPMSFIDYTDAARARGLSALKAEFRANKSAAKKAAKEPAPVAASAPAVTVAPEAPVATEAVVEANAPAAESGAWDAGYPVASEATVEATDSAAPVGASEPPAGANEGAPVASDPTPF